MRLMTARKTRVANAATRLEALSPLAVLNRGYALVYAEGGGLLRDAGETRAGERIRARLATGTVTATVLETEDE
jgi:exodeoxyribonuclease VII large subunit